MTPRIVSPMNDHWFKRVLGEQSRVDIITDFMQAVIDIPKQEYADVRILETPKLPAGSDNQHLNAWMQYFAARTDKELAMITKDYPAINKAVHILKELSADEKEYRLAEEAEKIRRDEVSRLAHLNSVTPDSSQQVIPSSHTLSRLVAAVYRPGFRRAAVPPGSTLATPE